MKRAKPAIGVAITLLSLCLPTLHSRAGSIETSQTVSGTVAYRQRIALPPHAVVTVRVEDISKADAPAEVIAEIREPAGARQVPISFSLHVPGSKTDPRSIYTVRAVITVDDRLLFTTTRNYPVLTHDASNHVNLMLEMVTSPAADTEPRSTGPSQAIGFNGTSWKLIELDGRQVPTDSAGKRHVSITFSYEGEQMSAFGGCNRLGGSYIQEGEKVSIKGLIGTMMACEPEKMELESRVLKLLGDTTSFRILDRQLILLKGEQELARFEAETATGSRKTPE